MTLSFSDLFLKSLFFLFFSIFLSYLFFLPFLF